MTDKFNYVIALILSLSLLPHEATATSGLGLLYYPGLTIIVRHTTVSRTPLEEWSAQSRKLSVRQHTNLDREPAIPACGRPQTHALDRTATGIDATFLICEFN
jgi:hypothetical protein